MNVKYENFFDWCKKNNKEYLLSEWDYNKNVQFTPSEITPGSSKRVWWRCGLGHSWSSPVSVRALNGHGCVYCANQKPLKGFNDFETWCLNNDRKSLLDEWDYIRNRENPDCFVWCSGKSVHWKCRNNHSWETTISHRVSEKTGCPICGNKKVLKGYNDLKTLEPDIAKEWNFAKNGNRKPEDYSVGSSEKVWWLCEKGHEWEATIYSRTGKQRNGCAVCSGKRLFKGENDLYTICQNEPSLLHLLSEWDYENNELTPFDVTAHTNKKVNWKCEYGHNWSASISSRVAGNGCKYCSNQTSFPEQALFYYLSKYFNNVQNRYIVSRNIELDIFIPTKSIGIEYDGRYYHHNKEQKEQEKNEYCKENNITLIRIREQGLRNYDNCICIERKEPEKESSLDEAIRLVLKIIDESIEADVNILRDKSAITKSYKNRMVSNSIIVTNPELLIDWDWENNDGVNPGRFTKGSHYKANWVCHVCGYSWKTEIKVRTSGSGCKKCSMESFINKRALRVQNVNTGIIYKSLISAQKDTGVERHLISECCKGKRREAGGFIWRFV